MDALRGGVKSISRSAAPLPKATLARYLDCPKLVTVSSYLNLRNNYLLRPSELPQRYSLR